MPAMTGTLEECQAEARRMAMRPVKYTLGTHHGADGRAFWPECSASDPWRWCHFEDEAGARAILLRGRTDDEPGSALAWN